MTVKFLTKRNFLTFAVLLLLIAIVLDPYVLGFCIHDKSYCLFDDLAHSVGKPLFYISIGFFVSTLVSLFTNLDVFLFWARIGIWGVIIVAILTYLTPEYGGAGIVSIDRGAVSFILSALYLIISLILIAYKSWKLRGT